jgi:hypothetical protein
MKAPACDTTSDTDRLHACVLTDRPGWLWLASATTAWGRWTIQVIWHEASDSYGQSTFLHDHTDQPSPTDTRKRVPRVTMPDKRGASVPAMLGCSLCRPTHRRHPRPATHQSGGVALRRDPSRPHTWPTHVCPPRRAKARRLTKRRASWSASLLDPSGHPQAASMYPPICTARKRCVKSLTQHRHDRERVALTARRRDRVAMADGPQMIRHKASVS